MTYKDKDQTFGRPTTYSEEIVAKFLARIQSGDSMFRACRRKGMPDRETIYRWMDKHEDFRGRYARATEARADMRFEKMDEIARDVELGFLDPQAGRLMIDTLKWQASKEKPKRYGDRSALDLTNSDGSMKSNLEARMQALINRMTAAKQKADDGSDLA